MPAREESKYWLAQRQLILHAARCRGGVVKGIVEDEEVAWVLHCLGYRYSDWCRMGEAEKMYQRALQGYKKAWGPRAYINARHVQQAKPSLC